MAPYVRLFIFVGLLVAGIVSYLGYDAQARELAFTAMTTIVGVIFTPFLLEFSFFVTGCFILAFVLQWQRARDGDEWVEVSQDKKSEE